MKLCVVFFNNSMKKHKKYVFLFFLIFFINRISVVCVSPQQT